MRWLTLPLVHFVAGGAVLFVLVHGVSQPGVPSVSREPVVLTAADVERLRDDYARETGLVPTAADESALVDRFVDEELLFREALARGLDHDRSVRTWLIEQMKVLDDEAAAPEQLYARARALGLDRTDAVVRRILVQKMRLLAARLDERDPTDDELRAFYATARDDYRVPARVSFWHAFFAARSGEEAGRALDDLRRGRRPPTDAARHGDPFPLPGHVVGQTPAQLEKLFGAGFAAALGEAPVGRWVGPLPSAYGVHLVWIEERTPGEAPPFEAVRSRVLERWRDGERRRRVAGLLRELKTRYPVHVESTAWREAHAS